MDNRDEVYMQMNLYVDRINDVQRLMSDGN